MMWIILPGYGPARRLVALAALAPHWYLAGLAALLHRRRVCARGFCDGLGARGLSSPRRFGELGDRHRLGVVPFGSDALVVPSVT